MDSKTAEKFHRIARTKVKKTGSKEDAEDIAQGVILSWLEFEKKNHRQCKQTVSQAITEQVRAIQSRKCKDKLEANRLEYLRDAIKTAPDALESILLWDLVEAITYAMSSTQRAMLILKCVYGFDSNEIARVFGISKGRVSQRFKEMAKNLK